VIHRPEGMVNTEMPTGEVELDADELYILNESETPPFEVAGKIETSEGNKLKYRFLELRRPEGQKIFLLRHRLYQSTRNFLASNGFIEIETPFLTKSTPEGARDYVVPSRIEPGSFYALPQSPQLFKQMLMVSGFDKYFQIVKCFRDEDLRADRQPEFTQIDMELSFIDEEDIYIILEEMMKSLFKEVLSVDVEIPFTRLSYKESMDRFGVDNPDLRFGLELTDISPALKSSEFKVFSAALEKGGAIKALTLKGGASFSRKELDGLTEVARTYGVGGLVWIKINPDGWQSPIKKFLNDEEKKGIKQKSELYISLFFSYSQKAEHFRLKVLPVNTDAAAANLSSVQDKIICPGAYFTRIRIQKNRIFCYRRSKWMVYCYPSFFLFGIFKQRKFVYPYKFKFLRGL